MLLVGFVEGDGSFSVNIEIHISDIKLLYKIKSILGGFGSITTRKRTNTEVARLKISSKNDLISLPIFDKYGMLTNKQHDYLYFKSCLLQNITYYLPIYAEFDAWLIGFMEAEFSTYQVTGESN